MSDREEADGDDPDATDDRPANDGQRFDRLPATPADREVSGRASRQEVLTWWDDRFGIAPERFAAYTFWERGAGKIWAFRADAPDPTPIEGLGLTFLRTRQEHWKPTTSAVQRFGREATDNVLDVDPEEAARFAAGEDQEFPRWDGDWGYLVVAHEIAGRREPIGVGLYVYDELKSMMPKGRQEELAPRPE
ncbi:MAG: hypothetical protein ABEJ79_11590 [Halolamina sp.]